MSQSKAPDGEGRGLKIFSFVVHLWKEQSGSDRSVWRGSLTDVRNGERRYFQSLTGLMKMFSEFIGNTASTKGGKFNR